MLPHVNCYPSDGLAVCGTFSPARTWSPSFVARLARTLGTTNYRGVHRQMEKSTVHLFVFNAMSGWEYGYLVAGINNPQFQSTP